MKQPLYRTMKTHADFLKYKEDCACLFLPPNEWFPDCHPTNERTEENA